MQNFPNRSFFLQTGFISILGTCTQWICGFVCSCRYKGKSYRASMRIVCLAEQVADFCRRVCVRLQCCPNLFGPILVSEKCPENCSVHTKTKYSKCVRVNCRRQGRKEGPKKGRGVRKERQEISWQERDAERYIKRERNRERYMRRGKERGGKAFTEAGGTERNKCMLL